MPPQKGSIHQGLQRLIQEKVQYSALQNQQNAIRQAKLKAFLDAYHHASQWAVCLAALYDARKHGVPPTDSMIEDVMKRCGASGRIGEVKRLYTSFYQSLSRPRPLSAHVTFMSACTACGAFEEAKAQLDKLIESDVRRFKKNSSHLSIVTDDLMTEYLKTALAAHVRGQKTIPIPCAAPSPSSSSSLSVSNTEMQSEKEKRSSGSSSDRDEHASKRAKTSSSSLSIWEIALSDLVRLRLQYPPGLFRSRLEWTPLLLECAAQLADVGDQWVFALRLLRSAGKEQALIPPEAYDAVIRVCYRHHRYVEVVQLLETMIATQSSPDERSVRLGLVAAEEVEARNAKQRLILPSPDFLPPFRGGSTGKEGVPVEVTPPLDSPLNRREHVPFSTGSSGDNGGGRASSTTCENASSLFSPSSIGSSSRSGASCAWSLSLTLFQSMRLNGVLMYQQSYESPLRASAVAGKWEEAMQMLDYMRHDGRPVSTALFRLVVASRIEHQCTSFASVRQLLSLPSLQGDHGIVVLYLAAMRWCVGRKDWKNLEALHKEMLDKDIPESYDKIRLLIEAAYHQGRYHAVLARFARFYNITSYERRRVEKDQSARLYEDDFNISAPLLDMVLDAHAHLVKEEEMKNKELLRKGLQNKERNKSTNHMKKKAEMNGINEEFEDGTSMEYTDDKGDDKAREGTAEGANEHETVKKRKKDPILLIAYRAAKELKQYLYPPQ